MNDQWTDRLSEYVDGELAAGERTALEAHLVTCADCRATLDELRRVVARATSLEDRPPKADLWSGIHARLSPGRRPGVNRDATAPAWRVSFNVPQLIAASIALILLSGGGAWLALRPQPTQGSALGPRTGPRVTLAVSTGRTDAAIADLQDVFERNKSRLDTSTVRVVRQAFATIDRAIAEARTALQADPSNAYLNLHLADTMRRKLELLRRVNAIAAAQS
jgi:anti-sigma-K factor RskA